MTIITDIKQQEKLEKFFKEENTWFPDNVGEKFLAIFFFIISGILACAPNKMIDFSDLNNDMKVVLIGYMFYILGVTYMVMKYKSYQKKNNNKRTAQKHANRQDAAMDIHNKKENKTMCSNDGDNNSHKNNNNIGSL